MKIEDIKKLPIFFIKPSNGVNINIYIDKENNAVYSVFEINGETYSRGFLFDKEKNNAFKQSKELFFQSEMFIEGKK